MVREDILGGLRSSLIRGFSLKDAMLSFYNAGYPKEDIEEAARQLQYQMTENKDLRSLISQNNGKTSQNANATNLPASQKATPSAPQKPTPQYVKPKTSSQAGQATPSISTPQQIQTPPNQQPSAVSSPSETHEEKQPAQQFKPLNPSIEGREKITGASSYEPAKGMKVATIVLIVLLLFLLGILGAVFVFKDQIISFFNSLLK